MIATKKISSAGNNASSVKPCMSPHLRYCSGVPKPCQRGKSVFLVTPLKVVHQCIDIHKRFPMGQRSGNVP